MINSIVYTYWTNNGLNLKNNFKDTDALKKQWKSSYNLLGQYNENLNVIIYTDIYGCEIASECCQKAKIEIIDYSQYSFNKKFWNFPKIITYKKLYDANINFLHIDIDVDIIKSIPQEVLESDLVTEKVRANNMVGSFIYAMGWNFKKPLSVICSGLLGGNKIEVFDELYTLAINSKAYKDTNNNITEFHRHTLEEVSLASICNNKNIIPVELKGLYIHHQKK